MPSEIWDKTEPLTNGEQERIRMHAYVTERILCRATGLGKATLITFLPGDIGEIFAVPAERLSYLDGLYPQELTVKFIEGGLPIVFGLYHTSVAGPVSVKMRVTTSLSTLTLERKCN